MRQSEVRISTFESYSIPRLQAASPIYLQKYTKLSFPMTLLVITANENDIAFRHYFVMCQCALLPWSNSCHLHTKLPS